MKIRLQKNNVLFSSFGTYSLSNFSLYPHFSSHCNHPWFLLGPVTTSLGDVDCASPKARVQAPEPKKGIRRELTPQACPLATISKCSHTIIYLITLKLLLAEFFGERGRMLGKRKTGCHFKRELLFERV